MKPASTLRTGAAVLAALGVIAAPHAAFPKQKGLSEAPIVAQSNSPLLLVVSIRHQKVRVFDVNGEITSSRVSTGRPGFDTPTGVFSLLEKNVYHESNIYSGASMPYQQRITWSGVAFHAGVVPGFRASHGCIRLPYSFARKLFGITKIGNRVVIAQDDAEPIAFDSPKLFKPLPLDDDSAMRLSAQKAPQLAVNDQASDSATSDALQELPRMIGVTPALARAVADMPRDPRRRPTTRLEAEQIVQEKLGRAQVAVKTAEAANLAANDRSQKADAAYQTANSRFEEARQSIEPLRSAVKAAETRQQDALRAFEAFMSGAGANAASRPLTTGSISGGQDSETALEDAVLDATIAADKAQAESAKAEMSFAEVQATFSAAQAAREAASEMIRDAQADLSSAQTSLAELNKEMRLRSKPISVLVSLRAQRLYIRQGVDPLLEAPINVAPLQNKVGTHVFTAMRYGNDGNSFEWRLISAQTPAPGQPLDDGRGKKNRTRDASYASPRDMSIDTANAALAAFTIPDDILETISELAKPGSSLIVSDRELPANENGNGTEFVVLTR